MGRRDEDAGFTCVQCHRAVPPLGRGTYRNHCPFCLVSIHVDRRPGDRQASCRGLMEAVALHQVKKGLQLVHRCRRCGIERRNRVATEGDQPDDFDRLVEIATSAAERQARRAEWRRHP